MPLRCPGEVVRKAIECISKNVSPREKFGWRCIFGLCQHKVLLEKRRLIEITIVKSLRTEEGPSTQTRKELPVRWKQC